MTNDQSWQDQTLAALEKKTEGITEKSRKKYATAYISSAIQKVPVKIQSEEELTEFKRNTEELVASIPEPSVFSIPAEKKYLAELSGYKGILMKKFKMVPEGYYIAVFLPIGLCIGTSLGVATKNIGLGMPLGMLFGLVLGAAMNAKAKKEGKIL